MTLPIMIALLALVLWTMLPTPKGDTTAVRNQHRDDENR